MPDGLRTRESQSCCGSHSTTRLIPEDLTSNAKEQETPSILNGEYVPAKVCPAVSVIAQVLQGHNTWWKKHTSSRADTKTMSSSWQLRWISVGCNVFWWSQNTYLLIIIWVLLHLMNLVECLSVRPTHSKSNELLFRKQLWLGKISNMLFDNCCWGTIKQSINQHWPFQSSCCIQQYSIHAQKGEVCKHNGLERTYCLWGKVSIQQRKWDS